MAISTTTDWSRIRYIMLITFAINILLASRVATELATSGKQKRQLFREFLLPQLGGKIPDSALRPDRLALNRLNQHGIYTVDGVHLEHRRPEVHLHPRYWNTKSLKVTRHSDGSYTAHTGYHFESPRTIDTTYLIREAAKDSIAPHHRTLPVIPYTSLKLRYHRFHRSNGVFHSNWNDIFSSQDFPEKIFVEFSPYIKKFLEMD